MRVQANESPTLNNVVAAEDASDRLRIGEVLLLKDAGGEAVPIVVDLMNEAQLREAIHRTKETFGRIDIMVNNAGVMLLGKIEERLRLPMVPVSEPTRAAVRSAMVHAGLIN